MLNVITKKTLSEAMAEAEKLGANAEHVNAVKSGGVWTVSFWAIQ